MKWIASLCVPALLSQTIPQDAADRYFREARQICNRDDGKLWPGLPLCGPTMFIDPATRALVANQQDRDGSLQSDGPIFRGTWPASETLANTSVSWHGERWTQLVWPLPAQASLRLRLLLHESFHRVQDRLPIEQSMPANAHLDTEQGRTLLRLELRALLRRNIADALAFRTLRWQSFPSAEAEETALELNEGLAEDTGVRLASESPAARHDAVQAILASFDSRDHYARSFAYATGPAYGEILDSLEPAWRSQVKTGFGLVHLLRTAYAASAEAAYQGAALRSEEASRAAAQVRERQRWQALFVDGPVLRIPLRHMKIQFDPHRVQAFEGQGTIYGSLVIVDEWGRLEAPEALLDAHWSSVVVPLAAANWNLTLESGWSRSPAARNGDETLTQR